MHWQKKQSKMKEFSTFRTSLQESVEDLTEHSVLQGAMPPNILILRRKTVRMFPGGTMVALYYNDRLDQYFSIPYGGDTETTITPTSLKEEELDEAKKLNSSQLRVQRVAKKQREAADREDWDQANAEDSWKKKPLKEDAISHLQRVKAFKTDSPLRHKDGTQTKIDPTTANALLTVHDGLHPDNRQKFSDALEHSKGKFHKMLDFSWKQVK